MKILKYVLGWALLIIAPVWIYAQSAGAQITVHLSHCLSKKYIALYVTDEMTKSPVYAESYNGKNQMNGTDAGGNFIRAVSGLNASHTYSVTLLVDVDTNGSVNEVDIGKTVTGVAAGSTVVMDALNPLTALEHIAVSANAVPGLAGKKANCVLSESSYSYPLTISSGASLGLSGVSVIFFDANGNAAWNNMWVPAGIHGNMLCVVDMNNNNAVDSGDYYSIGNKAGSSNTDYSFGAWSVIN